MLKSKIKKPLKSFFTAGVQIEEEEQKKILNEAEEKKKEFLLAFKNKNGSLKTQQSLQKILVDELENIRIL